MYRWWTLRAWSDADGAGVKLGPLTLNIYVGRFEPDVDVVVERDGSIVPPRIEFFAGLCNRWVLIDTGVRRLRQLAGQGER